MDDDGGLGVTSPPVEWDGQSSMLIAYRLGLVESNLTRMNKRIEMFVSDYPNAATLQLILNPLKEELAELKTKEAARETAAKTQTAQWKLAMIMALVSPTAVIIINELINKG